VPRQLKVFVHVDGQWFGPDDVVPAEVAEQIGDHAWADDDPDEGEPEPSSTGPKPPPMGGKGSGTEAWAQYAEQLEVDLPDDANRDDIIDAIREAGHPVE